MALGTDTEVSPGSSAPVGSRQGQRDGGPRPGRVPRLAGVFFRRACFPEDLYSGVETKTETAGRRAVGGRCVAAPTDAPASPGGCIERLLATRRRGRRARGGRAGRRGGLPRRRRGPVGAARRSGSGPGPSGRPLQSPLLCGRRCSRAEGRGRAARGRHGCGAAGYTTVQTVFRAVSKRTALASVGFRFVSYMGFSNDACPLLLSCPA